MECSGQTVGFVNSCTLEMKPLSMLLGDLYEVRKKPLMWTPHPSVCLSVTCCLCLRDGWMFHEIECWSSQKGLPAEREFPPTGSVTVTYNMHFYPYCPYFLADFGEIRYELSPRKAVEYL